VQLEDALAAAVSGAAGRGSTNMEASAPGLMGRRILVIEDESMVSMLIEDTLVDMGCVVVALASRFDDGLAKAQTLAFDAAILDVNLAGERSFGIADALRLRKLPFVFATGYGKGSIPEPLRGAPILQKPFSPVELEQALLSALENGRNS
jgi:CheY-like chemotaxis protein